MEVIDYHDLITQPEAMVDRVIQFLQFPNLQRQAMIDAVDAKLYRSKVDKTGKE